MTLKEARQARAAEFEERLQRVAKARFGNSTGISILDCSDQKEAMALRGYFHMWKAREGYRHLFKKVKVTAGAKALIFQWREE